MQNSLKRFKNGLNMSFEMKDAISYIKLSCKSNKFYRKISLIHPEHHTVSLGQLLTNKRLCLSSDEPNHREDLFPYISIAY